MSGRALAKGWAPTFIGYSMQGLGRFGLYEYSKVFYADLIGEELAYQWLTTIYIAAAASGEFFADMLLAPMEATNFRIQTSPTAPPYLCGCVPTIYKSEGLPGFFRSLPQLLMRQIPYTMTNYYDWYNYSRIAMAYP
uniref:Uncharacterized protein n=1 Tax=Panagrolaimus sp. PS1159 TaxID=55785 RepID=A0AC35F7Z0_9BILA